jgi:hypothetical protein
MALRKTPQNPAEQERRIYIRAQMALAKADYIAGVPGAYERYIWWQTQLATQNAPGREGEAGGVRAVATPGSIR